MGFTNETFRIHVTILASVSIKKELLNHIIVASEAMEADLPQSLGSFNLLALELG